VRKGDRKKNGPGGSLSDLYTPEAAGATGDDDLESRLVEAGVVSSEMMANAKRVLKQTPGKHLAEVLTEMGAHEADVLPVVAELARLPFERVNAKDMSAFDAKAVQRLGPKFCQTNLARARGWWWARQAPTTSSSSTTSSGSLACRPSSTCW
jgi:hypothetical protein